MCMFLFLFHKFTWKPSLCATLEAEQTFRGRKHCVVGEKTDKFQAGVVRDEPEKWEWCRV